MLVPYAISCTTPSQSNVAGYDNIRNSNSDHKASHDIDGCEIYNDFVNKCKLRFLADWRHFDHDFSESAIIATNFWGFIKSKPQNIHFWPNQSSIE